LLLKKQSSKSTPLVELLAFGAKSQSQNPSQTDPKPDDVASCDSWSWVVSIPKAQSFSHVQVVPPVALYRYLYIYSHAYIAPCFPKFTAYKTSICFETTQYDSFTEPLLIHEYKKSLLCIYCSISSCKLYNKILLKPNWAVNCCTFVLHPSCNIVYSSVQNLSLNIMHSRGQKSILH